jgi:hypothetical protein
MTLAQLRLKYLDNMFMYLRGRGFGFKEVSILACYFHFKAHLESVC